MRSWAVWTGGRAPSADAGSVIVGALAGAKRHVEGRPGQRPSRFADAGVTLLRTSGENEIWCRCDGGPHGYLSIAAHAHADALSVEVRYAGIDILADPGTYCYHGERAWRSYFRSTIAHNTAELGGRNQSSERGPFMWARHAHAREVEVIDDGDIARWTAEHDGYASLDPPALHRRSVLLDRASRSIDIIDEIEGGSHDVRLAFHFGPEVQVELDGVMCSPELATGRCAWSGAAGTARRAPVEPAPGRDRSHPRLVLARPGTPRSRLHPSRLRTLRARCSASHAAGVPRDRCVTEACPIMVHIRRAGEQDARDPSGGHMSQQALDLRRSIQIVRRHKLLMGITAALGLLVGGAYAVLAPPMVTSTALVLLPQSGQAAQNGAAAAANGGPDPYTATQEVIAKSNPVLLGALPHVRPAMSLNELRSEVQIGSSNSIYHFGKRNRQKTPPMQRQMPMRSPRAISTISAPQATRAARSRPSCFSRRPMPRGRACSSRIVIYAVIALVGAIFGALIGIVIALAISRSDRRLRERDEIANSIGVPVLASFPVGHPSDPGGLDQAPGGLQARSPARPAAAEGPPATGNGGRRGKLRQRE